MSDCQRKRLSFQACWMEPRCTLVTRKASSLNFYLKGKAVLSLEHVRKILVLQQAPTNGQEPHHHRSSETCALDTIRTNGKKNKFIKTTFIQKNSFIKIHLHQKPASSKNNFIKNYFLKIQFHPSGHFHQKPNPLKTIFIKNHSHPKPFSSTKMKLTKLNKKQNKMTHNWSGTNNTVRVSVKASPAEGRRRLHKKKHGLCPPFAAGDAPHDGLFKVEWRGFRYLGYSFSGLGV